MESNQEGKSSLFTSSVLGQLESLVKVPCGLTGLVPFTQPQDMIFQPLPACRALGDALRTWKARGSLDLGLLVNSNFHSCLLNWVVNFPAVNKGTESTQLTCGRLGCHHVH
jgi:hypothetical protein